MKQLKEAASYAVEQLKKHEGLDAECYIDEQTSRDVVFSHNDLSLMRSSQNMKFRLKCVHSDGRFGAVSVSRCDRDTVNEAVERVLKMVKQEDAHKDINESICDLPDKGSFCNGPLEPDKEKLLFRAKEFMEDSCAEDDSQDFSGKTMSHILRKRVYLNSNGTDFDQVTGYYDKDTFRGVKFLNLDQKVYGYGQPEKLFDPKIRKMEPVALDAPFEGTVMLAPGGVKHFWWHSRICSINETMISMVGKQGEMYKLFDMVGEKIAGEEFTLSQKPLDPRFAGAELFTSDGYASQNVTIFENGVFKAYPLSRKGSLTLGRERNSAPDKLGEDTLYAMFNLVIEPGKTPAKDMLKSIDKGILLFALGASPNYITANITSQITGGFLVEHGEVTKVVKCMLHMNFYEMLKNIRHISKETVFNGTDETPWMSFDGVLLR